MMESTDKEDAVRLYWNFVFITEFILFIIEGSRHVTRSFGLIFFWIHLFIFKNLDSVEDSVFIFPPE